MVNVLVLGATGYLGEAVASSLVRSGEHIVYGLARTAKAAQQLQTLEVIPVQGSFDDTAALLALITEAPIDIVINCAVAGPDSNRLLPAIKDLAAARVAAYPLGPKLGYIYVSGTWIHGSGPHAVNDLEPVGTPLAKAQPCSLVSWRPAFERELLAARNVLDVAIARPALIYGRAGAIWSALFSPIVEAAASESSTASLDLPVQADSRPSLIHVDDVATGMHAVIEKLPLLSGTGVYPVFDFVTSHEPMQDILQAAARAAGFKGTLNLKGPGDNAFMQAMSTSNVISSGRAKQLLGWQPTRLAGFANGMSVYFAAWKASAGKA